MEKEKTVLEFLRRHDMSLDIMNASLSLILAPGCSEFCRSILIAAPATVLIASILFGNFLVILAVFTQPELSRGKHNWYVVSLALADLLVGACVMPFTLCYEIYGLWPFGTIWCDVWLALDVLFVTASILNLLVISIDRYWAVSDTSLMIRNRTPCRVLFFIAISWVAALAVSLPPLFGWRRKRIEFRCSLSTDLSYVLYSAFGSFYIPLSALLIIYYKIFRIMKVRNRSRILAAKKMRDCLLYKTIQSTALTPARFAQQNKNLVEQKPDFCDEDSLLKKQTNGESIAEAHNPCDEQKLLKKEQKHRTLKKQTTVIAGLHKRSTFRFKRVSLRRFSAPSSNRLRTSGIESHKLSVVSTESSFLSDKHSELRRQDRRSMLVLGFILSAFIICWLPFFILYVFQAIAGQFQTETGRIAFTVIFWMGYVNSALNPIIYAALNPQFKKAFKKILGIRGKRFLCC